MLSNLILVWYAAIAPAFGRVLSGVMLAVFAFSGEAFGQYPQGTFVVVALLLFIYTHALHTLLRESGARSLALYTAGAVLLYVLALATSRMFAGGSIHWSFVLFWAGELLIGAAVVQACARPERILHARHERYAKVEEVFRV